jgi:GTP pyrophosphokinase
MVVIGSHRNNRLDVGGFFSSSWIMQKRNEPNINSWNLYQLARVIIQNERDNDRDLNTICPILNEAFECVEKIEQEAPSLPSQYMRSGQDSLQVAMVAVTELSLGLTASLSAILLPAFLEGLISSKTIELKFGDKVALVLEEAKTLQNYRIQDNTIRNYASEPDIHSPHIVAILLTIADIIRLHCSGVLLGHEMLKYVGSSSQFLSHLKYFYIPLCHRMHLYEVQAKLADFWLKHSDTLSYYYITAKLGMTKLQRRQRLEIISEEIRTLITNNNIEFVMKTRIKSVYSIWYKIQKLNVNFEGIYDLSAIRIILTSTNTKTIEEEKILCWTVFSMLSQLYTPMYEIMRDWISVPRSSGYESLHLTLKTAEDEPFEVQIRTERMDYIAEHGDAAHWKYKCSS